MFTDGLPLFQLFFHHLLLLLRSCFPNNWNFPSSFQLFICIFFFFLSFFPVFFFPPHMCLIGWFNVVSNNALIFFPTPLPWNAIPFKKVVFLNGNWTKDLLFSSSSFSSSPSSYVLFRIAAETVSEKKNDLKRKRVSEN